MHDEFKPPKENQARKINDIDVPYFMRFVINFEGYPFQKRNGNERNLDCIILNFVIGLKFDFEQVFNSIGN